MTLHTRILAGTALGLLMGAAPGLAQAPVPSPATETLILAQAAPEAPPRPKQEEQEEQEEQDEQPSGEEAPAPSPAPASPAPEAPAAEAAPAAPEDVPAAAQEPAPTEPAPAPAAPAAEPSPGPAPAAEPVEPPREAAPEQPAEAPAASEPQPKMQPSEQAPADPATETAPQAPAPSDAATPAAEPAPSTEAPLPSADPSQEPAAADAPAATPETQVPADQPAPADAEDPTGDAAPAEAAKPAGEEAASETRRPRNGEGNAERPRRSERGDAPVAGDPEDATGEAETGLPENAAPVLDSAKEQVPDGAASDPAGEAPVEAGEQPDATQDEAAPPPASDADAQARQARPERLDPITATEGRRIDRAEARRERRERPEGAEVLRDVGGRLIIQFGNQTTVESNDVPRLSRDAREVYYEELPRGLQRETIVRPNGSRVITIRDRYGDVIRRSRITPEGREIVLVYVPEERRERVRDWRDPARDLPPLRLTIPVREYILDTGRVEDPGTYYEFLDQPPVEEVRQLYSVDEVKRSARLRDVVRRIDLDTITFETGSADISRSEVDELEGIADAMLRMLDENPAETFLIEGHTDAVGSDISNLALSDARAESVAEVLTQVYGIPPENLVTQGYGERYLKIDTASASRENRRVAIRRITPLVTPVASR